MPRENWISLSVSTLLKLEEPGPLSQLVLCLITLLSALIPIKKLIGFYGQPLEAFKITKVYKWLFFCFHLGKVQHTMNYLAEIIYILALLRQSSESFVTDSIDLKPM